MCGCLQYSSRNLPGGSKSTYLLNVGDMVYAGANAVQSTAQACNLITKNVQRCELLLGAMLLVMPNSVVTSNPPV